MRNFLTKYLDVILIIILIAGGMIINTLTKQEIRTDSYVQGSEMMIKGQQEALDFVVSYLPVNQFVDCYFGKQPQTPNAKFKATDSEKLGKYCVVIPADNFDF